MLVITLGTQASGSTWLFNVVRALFACAGRAIFCSSADDGVDALDKMPVRPGDVVLKSHSMDQRLLRIAELARAKLIVSTRDPLDSMVSQRERFSQSSKLAAVDLTRSFATIESLPRDLDRLTFRYEDCFTQRRSTIFELARFLGLTVSQDQGDRIFQDLEPSTARRDDDPLAHWHPNHVGDGRVGKWRERLDASAQSMAAGCLTPLASPELWKHRPLRWSAELFSYDGEREAAEDVELECDGEARTLVYGPYLHLPCGRWRATPCVEAVGFGDGPKLAADVYHPWSGGDPAATREARIRRRPGAELSMRFDHHDHFSPVEVRLMSLAGSEGRVRFSGCDLDWLGPCDEGLPAL